MKAYFSLLLLLVSAPLWAQQDTAAGHHGLKATYIRHSVVATAALGFIDANRSDYSVPVGFSKGNVSGFIPFFAKLEYGITDHISLGATFCYDAFVYNMLHEYTGYNGPFTRYKTNNTRILNGGISAFYHLGSTLHSRRLDPFIGLGISLNNIRYRANPQADSTTIKIDHTVTPYLKIGTRYYISDKFSLFGDLGYDKQALLSIGVSCRFYKQQ